MEGEGLHTAPMLPSLVTSMIITNPAWGRSMGVKNDCACELAEPLHHGDHAGAAEVLAIPAGVAAGVGVERRSGSQRWPLLSRRPK